MYDVGIIREMGPKTTSTLFDIIVNYTDASSDQDHPSIVILNNTKIPDRTSYILERGETSSLESLNQALDALSGLVKPDGTIRMVGNTAHFFTKNCR